MGKVFDKEYSLFPIQNHDIYDAYKDQLAAFWTPDEIDLSNDMRDFETLSESEKDFIKWVLAFFAASDGIVLDNLSMNFMSEVPFKEARMAYYPIQSAIEGVHSDMYGRMIDNLVRDDTKKLELFNAIETHPSITEKAKFCKRWMDNTDSLVLRLAAYLCVEGIFFSSSFAAIYWIQDNYAEKFNGLVTSNHLIAIDEEKHAQFAVLLLNKLGLTSGDKENIQKIFDDAYTLECEFIDSLLPEPLLGINSEKLKEYTLVAAQTYLKQLGIIDKVTAKHSLHFMEKLALPVKANFFEKKELTYQKANVKEGFDNPIDLDWSDF